jgi:hypothetical protein
MPTLDTLSIRRKIQKHTRKYRFVNTNAVNKTRINLKKFLTNQQQRKKLSKCLQQI